MEFLTDEYYWVLIFRFVATFLIFSIIAWVVFRLMRGVLTSKPSKKVEPAKAEGPSMVARWVAWFVRNNELLYIPIGVVLWWVHPTLLRMLDPTSATIDSGVGSAIFFSISASFIYKGVVFWTHIGHWPKVNDFFNDKFESTWDEMKPGQKMAAALVLLFLPQLLLVLLTMAVL